MDSVPAMLRYLLATPRSLRIMEDPKLLILDEPFNGLDKHGVAEIRSLLIQLRAEGKTIIMSSHNQEDIDFLCDSVIRIDAGTLYNETRTEMID